MGSFRRTQRNRRFPGTQKEVVYAFSIDAVTPSSTTTSAVDVPVALTTTGAPAGVVAYLNGVAYPANTSWVSATLTNVTIPAALLAAVGSVSIRLVQGGSTSNTVSFLVTALAPTLASVAPSRYDQTDTGTSRTYTLTGTNFYNDPAVTQVYVDGVLTSYTFGSTTSLSVTLLESSARVRSFYVVNVGPGGGTTATRTANVNYPLPVVASVAPSTALNGAGDVPITVTGTGGTFRAASVITCDGVDLTTNPVDADTLTATIPASVTAVQGTKVIRVRNPTTASGGGVSTTSANFVVGYPTPTLTSISPTKLRWNDPATDIVLAGSGMSAASVAKVNNVAQTTNTSSQPTSVKFTYTPGTQGEYNITVANPGTANSASQTLAVVPVITSITPNTGIQYDPSTITAQIVGSGFTATTVPEINGIDCPVTSWTSTTLNITIPGTVSINAGAQTVRVKRAAGAPTSIDSVTYTLTAYDPLVTATGNYASYDADHVTLDTTPGRLTDVVGIQDIVGGVGPFNNTTNVAQNPVLIATDTSLNNYASIDYNGTTDKSGTTTSAPFPPLVTTLFPAGNWTVSGIIFPRTCTTNDSATPYNNNQVFSSDTNPGIRTGLGLRTNGGSGLAGSTGLLEFWMFDGAFKKVSQAIAFGAWSYFVVRKNGTNLSISVKNASFTTTASVNNMSATTQRVGLGASYPGAPGGTKYFDGKFRALIFGNWGSDDFARFANYNIYRLGIT